MTSIINWTVRRSGAAMTITGTSKDTGLPVVLTGIVRIEARSPGKAPIATTGAGARFELA